VSSVMFIGVPEWFRREQRPPVGMRADQTSHKWVPHWRKSGIWTWCQGQILITRSSPQKFVISDGSGKFGCEERKS
jgi:hypothetical protein